MLKESMLNALSPSSQSVNWFSLQLLELLRKIFYLYFCKEVQFFDSPICCFICSCSLSVMIGDWGANICQHLPSMLHDAVF